MFIDTAEDAQRLRSKLRIQYLRGLASMFGKHAEFQLYHTIELSGKLKGADPDGKYLCVKNLKTPIQVFPHAYLRAYDLISISVENDERTR